MNFGKTAEDYVILLKYCKLILEDIRPCPVVQDKEMPPAKLLDEAYTLSISWKVSEACIDRYSSW